MNILRCYSYSYSLSCDLKKNDMFQLEAKNEVNWNGHNCWLTQKIESLKTYIP